MQNKVFFNYEKLQQSFNYAKLRQRSEMCKKKRVFPSSLSINSVRVRYIYR